MRTVTIDCSSGTMELPKNILGSSLAYSCIASIVVLYLVQLKDSLLAVYTL